jgi:hypothetical protein
VVSTPAQITFAPEDRAADAVVLIDGPVLRYLDTEQLRDETGRRLNDAAGRPRYAGHRVTTALDPDALIAQTVLTADLLDWMILVFRGRALVEDQEVTLRMITLPSDLRRPGRPTGLPVTDASVDAVLVAETPGIGSRRKRQGCSLHASCEPMSQRFRMSGPCLLMRPSGLSTQRSVSLPRHAPPQVLPPWHCSWTLFAFAGALP